MRNVRLRSTPRKLVMSHSGLLAAHRRHAIGTRSALQAGMLLERARAALINDHYIRVSHPDNGQPDSLDQEGEVHARHDHLRPDQREMLAQALAKSARTPVTGRAVRRDVDHRGYVRPGPRRPGEGGSRRARRRCVPGRPRSGRC
jgi:hypothetical protein